MCVVLIECETRSSSDRLTLAVRHADKYRVSLSALKVERSALAVVVILIAVATQRPSAGFVGTRHLDESLDVARALVLCLYLKRLAGQLEEAEIDN